MSKISLIFIILFIIGCVGTKGKKPAVTDSRQKSVISIYSQHWDMADDSLNLFLHMRLRLNQFVFRKRNDHFFSNVTYTLIISHTEKNIQVYRESWSAKVTQQYYEDTRNPDNYYTNERNITLAPGTYKLFLNVQDADSRRNWQLSEEYELAPNHVLGPVLPFINNENLQKSIAVNILGKMDTIWLRTQVTLQDTIIDTINEINLQDQYLTANFNAESDTIKNIISIADPDQIDYIVSWKGIQIDSGKVTLSGMESNQLYYIPIILKEPKRGWYEITLSFQGVEQSASFSYNSTGKRYWTDDVDEVIGVMQYIFLSHSEYKKLKNLDASSQWDYIHEYWKTKDPSPETDENELLIQLNGRVQFVNKNFSILIPGWRSDRGRIYIIYGPPHYVDESYQGKMGYTYQKWVYPNGKQFVFIDRNMSGDYSLYREMY